MAEYMIVDGRADFDIDQASIFDYLGYMSFKKAVDYFNQVSNDYGDCRLVKIENDGDQQVVFGWPEDEGL